VLEVVSMVDRLLTALDAHAVSYFVTGSFASSFHGEYRATADIDVVIDIAAAQTAPLVRALQSDFFADDQQAINAVVAGASFNVIDRASFMKVDFFLLRTDFDRSAMRRAKPIEIVPGTKPVRIASAEDVVLAKLRWYRLGDHVSEVQRRDLIALARSNAGRLDPDYLRTWAAELHVLDLLDRLLAGSL
jgi:hypothetical protein